MKPIVTTVDADNSGESTSRMVRLDNWRHCSGVGLQAVVSPSFGNSSYTVEYSLDDPNDEVNPIPIDQMQWFTAGEFAATNESKAGEMPQPPLYIRCRLSGTEGSVRLSVLQFRRGFAP